MGGALLNSVRVGLGARHSARGASPQLNRGCTVKQEDSVIP